MKQNRGNYEQNRMDKNGLTNPLKSLDKINTNEFYKFLLSLNAKFEVGETYSL